MGMRMSEAEQGLVSIACFQKEVYMLSDVVLPDGCTLRPELLQRGAWTVTNTACAALSAVLMREVADKGTKLRVPLEGERTGNSWLRRGRTVGGLTAAGELVIGRVLASWHGWTAVSGWEAWVS